MSPLVYPHDYITSWSPGLTSLGSDCVCPYAYVPLVGSYDYVGCVPVECSEGYIYVVSLAVGRVECTCVPVLDASAHVDTGTDVAL